MIWRLPTVKLALHWNQWLLGAMLDYGRILPVRWIVFVLGPLTVSISAGRRAPATPKRPERAPVPAVDRSRSTPAQSTSVSSPIGAPDHG